ncbi:MAG: PAAR domain-containing protein [Fretibacterium sp.]|nr:PAAR domain-containing protein [Fretibacterium sp.]
MVNGRPLHCQGHGWATHCCTHPNVPHGCHSSVLASGSGTVIAEGRQAGRIDDPVACGGNVATGSDDVIIGG